MPNAYPLRMRRGFVAIAAASIMLGTFLVATPAMAESYTLGELSYEYDGTGGATLTAFTGSGATLTIPASVTINSEVVAVTAIASGVSSSETLTKIVIPASVTLISGMAFTFAPRIANVVFWGNAPTIEVASNTTNAFGSAETVMVHRSLGATGWGSKLGDYEVSIDRLQLDGVTYGFSSDGWAYVWSYTDSETSSLVIPATVTYDSVSYPVGTIKANAFSDAGGTLTTITIMTEGISIETDAFTGATALTSVYFDGSAPSIVGSVFGATERVTLYAFSNGDGWDLDENDRWNGYLVIKTIIGEGAATLGVTPGTRSVSLGAIDLGDKAVSHSVVSYTSEPVNLSVDDLSGSAAGWQISLDSTDFVWSAGDYTASGNANISKSLFTVALGSDVLSVEGGELTSVQPGLANPTAFGASPVPVLNASVGFGEGAYTLPLVFNLQLPGNSRAGIYTATVTATLSLAP